MLSVGGGWLGARLARLDAWPFRVAILTFVLIAIGLPASARPGAGRSALEDGASSFEDRVRCRRAVEEVYWRQRIWPEVNPGRKPAFEEVLPDAVLRERVATELEKSAALEMFWSRPLTGEQLQAEINRMVRNSKRPGLLRELFSALDDDPLLVAECLARPVLVDRLTRNWYARDDRVHGELRERAEAEIAKLANHVGMRGLGGDYTETLWRLHDGSKLHDGLGPEAEAGGAVDLDQDRWRERIEKLAEYYGIDRELDTIGAPPALLQRIPMDRVSPLVEEVDRFLVTVVLSKGTDELRTATVTWNKRPFDTWWVDEGRAIEGMTDFATGVQPPRGGYELGSPLDDGCTDDTWVELWYVPTERRDHTAVWTGSEMIVWGGHRSINTGGRYDPATDSWTQTSVGEGLPAGRHDHTAVWTGTEMIVWGGDQRNDDIFLRSGGRYDPVTDSWAATSTEPGVPSNRANHTAVWTGTEMIVWGGESGSSPLRTGGRYDPASDAWTPTPIGFETPTGREGHTAVWTGTEMVVWGGDEGGSYANTGSRYDPERDGWTTTSTALGVPVARRRHTAVWTGTEMIVWGGFNGAYLNTGARYDPATDDWTTVLTGPSVPAGREDHTSVWTGTSMIVWGGTDGPITTDDLNTGGQYFPSTNSWTPTSTEAGVPIERDQHTAVWTGTEMIVWGGRFHRTDTGGRYDPVSDSWVATATDEGVLTGRADHAALWTGAEMIVWGGESRGYDVNTGGRYDPASDSWTATSMTDVPEATGGFTAVWTGTKMIVWGGYHSFFVGSVNDGGEYDPTTDSWTHTSVGDGVVGARHRHTAVWTGTEMIVWGGNRTVFLWIPFTSKTYALESGGRYDPSARSWTATTTAPGAASPRVFHTAVWTGTEMVVWGGYQDETWPPGYLNTGARYNAELDRWTPTSTESGVPTARRGHTSVWTGAEMIVWGDYDLLNSGGRYDPLTDSWTATSLGTGVPTGKRRHVTVWTGSEMIVWGGIAGGDSQLGGRYSPATDSWSPTSTAPGVPPGRFDATAVWTGTEMIVWGGYDSLNTGGLYCACEGGTVSTWYPDADGDGLGMESTGIPVCEQPPGHVAIGGDCDDRFAGCTTECTDADADGVPACAPDCDETNPYCSLDCTDDDADTFCVTHDCDDADPLTHPGADEVNDGEDNHCLYDHGYGIVDEITGICGFHNPANRDEFSWPPQVGATSYEVARSTERSFSVDCLVTPTTLTQWVDTDPVAQGTCHYYLVRSTQIHLGSWGPNSAGLERTPACP